MFKKVLAILSVLALARAQIPSLGWCPEYVPMANFDMNRFLGVWYEAERYFQLSEVVSRCVMANYTKATDGKYRVSNEVTNRITGIKRVLEGEIKPAASKAEEGKLHVKYTTVPLTPETRYSVLETDYDNYAVLWSCSGIGPIHTQNAWLMTRERIPPGTILQKAYGVLDKYKISKSFFVKTNQEDCAYIAAAESKPTSDKPAAAAAPPAEASQELASASESEAEPENATKMIVRSIVPDAPKIIAQQQNGVDSVPETIMKVAEAKKNEKSAEEMKQPLKEKEEPALKRKSDIKA